MVDTSPADSPTALTNSIGYWLLVTGNITLFYYLYIWQIVQKKSDDGCRAFNLLSVLAPSIGVRQGVAMDSLKFHSSPPCRILLCLADETRVKRSYGHFRVDPPQASGVGSSSTLSDTPCCTPTALSQVHHANCIYFYTAENQWFRRAKKVMNKHPKCRPNFLKKRQT
jgi:hypothetical protein